MGKKNEEIEKLILSPRNERVAPLWAWLMKHDATCSWQTAVMGLHGDPKRRMATIECWRVGAAVVLIKVDPHGWSIYSELNATDIGATLADAEHRCSPLETTQAWADARAVSIHPDEIDTARKYAEGILLAASIVERCHRAERGADEASRAAVRQLILLRAAVKS